MRRIFSCFQLATALVLTACNPSGQERPLVTDGVARLEWKVRANGTDLVPVTLFYPSDADGRPTGASLPAVVLIQGGAVTPARYAWQAMALARLGYVVAQPTHPNDLAFFGIDFGQVARQALVDPELSGGSGSFLTGAVDPQRIAVGGHSLGGVVSVKLALGGGFKAAIVQASFPDPADDANLRSLGIPTLSLAGQQDCQAKEAQVREGWQKLPSPSALVVLEGVTHFQFTESDAEDVRRSCVPSTSLDVAHQRILSAMSAFLSGALGTPAGVGEPALRQLPGAAVEVK